jgi:sugar-specific transcriptional regulator TrmB
MVKENIKEALEKFGLNDNEIKVYTACLQIGSSSVTRISEKAEIYRTLTYEILKSLTEKGLVSSVVKNKKKYFEAASPNQLKALLKEKEKLIDGVLPELTAMQKVIGVKKPTITMYEGKAGIKAILEDLLATGKDFVAYSSAQNLAKLLKYYLPHFLERRVKKGLKCKLILNSKPLEMRGTEYRIIPHEFTMVSYVYGDKVALITLVEEEPIGVIIENKIIAQNQMIAFELMWQAAKKH